MTKLEIFGMIFVTHKYIGTGGMSEKGDGEGLFHNLNIALTKSGITNNILLEILHKIVMRLGFEFEPSAVIICAGCDGLGKDSKGVWNLNNDFFVNALRMVLTILDVPTIVLGGGGYHNTETAKAWFKMVASIANIPYTNNVPKTHKYYSLFENPDATTNMDSGVLFLFFKNKKEKQK